MKRKIFAFFITAILMINCYVFADHSGVVDVRYMPGVHTAADFADGSGEKLTDPYHVTVDKNGQYTIFAIDAAGNMAVKTVDINNVRSNNGGGGGGGGGGSTYLPVPSPSPQPSVPPIDSSDQEEIKVSEKKLKYIKGYDDNTFRPDNPITRAEVATIMERLQVGEHTDGTKIFTDITGHWAAETIDRLAGDPLRGYEDETFRPDNPISRAEAASLLCRAFDDKLDTVQTEIDFPDVIGHWAEPDIKRLASSGRIQGYEDGTFRPDQAVSRAELVKIINGILLIKPDDEENRFNDLTELHWGYGDILAAAE